jgi:excisionase family DNA binding protein
MMADLVFYTSAEVAQLLRLHPQVVQRKLQAGAIPGYRIGREWRVERKQLTAWLEQHSNQRLRTPETRTVENFFTADGRLRAIPAQRSKRTVVLDRLVAEFEPSRSYAEREVNTILRRFHDDVATIRRELIASKKLVRTKSGIYKRAGSKEPALRSG